MPSLASQQIRAAFPQVAQPDLRPLAEQRHAWEEEATREPLPLSVTITPLLLAETPCELVQTPHCATDYLLIWLHGGGFTQGSCKTHRHLAAHLAQATLLPVLLVDYRLAPEYPFPAAMDDVLHVHQALLASGKTSSQLFIGGDSAGGGLAMSVLLALRAAHRPLPAAAILLSPWVDLTMSGESIQSRAGLDPLVQERDLHTCASQYIGAGDVRNPQASPVYADLHGLPPLLIHVGDHELLLSDAVRLAANAQNAGIAADW